MAEQKRHAEARLIAAMKRAGFSTQNTVKKIVTEVVTDAVDHIARLLDKVLDKQEEHDRRFDKVEAIQTEHSRKIDDLRMDLADTPSRKEFEQLRTKVDRFHPAN